MPHPDTSIYLVVICGVLAMVLVLIMAVAMKCKLKRDNGMVSAKST